MPSWHHDYLRSLAAAHGLAPAPSRPLDRETCRRALHIETRQVTERLHALKDFTAAMLDLRQALSAGRPIPQHGSGARDAAPADLVAYVGTLAARHHLGPADGHLDGATFNRALTAETADLTARTFALHRARTALRTDPALRPPPTDPTGTHARPTPQPRHGRPCTLRHGTRQTPHWHR